MAIQQRRALLGGSFDPPHIGHLVMAERVREYLKLDRVDLLVTAQPPHANAKQPVATAAQRVAMARLAVAGNPALGVDDRETRRAGPSYTIDTVRRYREAFPKATLYYLIGSDHVPQLSKWRSAAELAAATEFLVIPRPGQTPLSLPEPFRGETLRGFPLGISSSQIRARVRENLPIDDLVPAAVSEAIRNHHLYL